MKRFAFPLQYIQFLNIFLLAYNLFYVSLFYFFFKSSCFENLRKETSLALICVLSKKLLNSSGSSTKMAVVKSSWRVHFFDCIVITSTFTSIFNYIIIDCVYILKILYNKISILKFNSKNCF